MPAPPPLAERLLRWSLADDERDAVLGDLQEEFNVISRVSLAHAARWYWSQAVLSIGPNLLRRVRSEIDGSRRLETEQSRRSRLKARKWRLTAPGQVEAVVSLRDLPPGDYRIRVTASDETLRTQRYGEFRIGEREFSVRDVRQ